MAFIFLLFSPLLIWFFKDIKRFLRNLFSVLIGKLSFVGYATIHHSSNLKLPKIKRGILPATLMVENGKLDDDAISRLNLIYAKNHSYIMDLKLIFRHFRRLDS